MSAADRQIAGAEVTAELRQEDAADKTRTALPQGNLENMEEQMIIRALEQTGDTARRRRNGSEFRGAP